MKYFLLIFLVIIALVGFFFLWKTPAFVILGDTRFRVEIADTPEERTQGLMYREFLPEKRGMLFVFEDEHIRSFWMKNTLISLDMIFINSKQEVVDVQTAKPCEEDPCISYTSQESAKYVLEVNAGIAKEYGVHIGDTVALSVRE